MPPPAAGSRVNVSGTGPLPQVAGRRDDERTARDTEIGAETSALRVRVSHGIRPVPVSARAPVDVDSAAAVIQVRHADESEIAKNGNRVAAVYQDRHRRSRNWRHRRREQQRGQHAERPEDHDWL